MIKKILILFISLSFFYVVLPIKTPQVLSSDIIIKLDREVKELEQKKQEIERRIASKQYEIRNLSETKDHLYEERNRLENELASVAEALELIKIEEELFRVLYTRSTEQNRLLTDSIDLKEKRSNQLIVTLYKNYMLNYTAYLLSSKSINEIIDNSLFLQYLFEADKNYFVKLKTEKEQLKSNILEQVQLQEDLYLKKSEKEKKAQELKELEEKKAIQIAGIITKEQIAQSILQNYLNEQDAIESQIQESIRKKAEEILKQKVLTTPMGPVIRPLAGYISSRFGMRMHPIFGVNRMHTGVDIDAPNGTPIVAVAYGIVAFSGWLGGYGNTVIIQHDEKHSTLYAHMSSLPVDKDQVVQQGELVGYVGMTGWTTGPHLHFEVRVYGDPVDPELYLPR
jgi:murein DD-endopeptidase MepM/ murein hydrolase activator NlpD